MISFLNNKKSNGTSNNVPLRKISLQEASFPIGHKELFYYGESGSPSKIGHKALVRPDTGEVLYVGKEYAPVPNADIYLALEPLEKRGWQFQDIRAYKSNVFSFTVVNPDIKFTLDTLEANASIIVTNSYDGSHALKIFVGGIIQVCSNGLTFGKGIEYSRKHTGSLDDFQEQLQEVTTKTLPKAISTVEKKQWVSSNDIDKLQHIWKQLVKPYPSSTKGQVNNFVVALNQQFQLEQSRGYSGELAMVMAATDLVTHQAEKYSPAYIMQLEKDIPKVFFSN